MTSKIILPLITTIIALPSVGAASSPDLPDLDVRIQPSSSVEVGPIRRHERREDRRDRRQDRRTDRAEGN